jgi:hypothetical protein
VAQDLDLAESLPFREVRPALSWLVLGAGLGVTALSLILIGPAALVLVGCVLAGMGLTYACGLSLRVEERLAYGSVLGPIVFSLVTFLLALVAGLWWGTVLLGLGCALGLGAIGWWGGRNRIRVEVLEAVSRWSRLEPWPLWVLLAPCWGFTLVFLAHAYQWVPQGLLAGGAGVYGDWALHLTLASSFAYGANLPPEFPFYPGHVMTYPFMIDFWAATLIPLGVSVTHALVLTSGLLGLALPAVLYFAWVRLAGQRLAAAIAVFIFLLSGGLGFAALLLGQPGAANNLLTQDQTRNLVWLNPVLAWIIPQRSVLFGFALVPIGLALLWSAREHIGWRSHAFTGVLTGLTPLFHLHAFGTLLALSAFWCLFDALERRSNWKTQWSAFFLPALLLGGPVAVWMARGGAASPHWQLGWLAQADGHQDNWLWFWIWNTGLLAPLMVLAFLWRGVLSDSLAVRLAPIWLWFLVPNLVVFQPWDWDNTKFFSYWALIGALPMALLLGRWKRRAAWVSVLLLISLTLSGAVDLARALDQNRNTALFTDAGGIRAAAWAQTHTDPHAIFLAAPMHNQPILCLAGRSTVAGYPGWLSTYGLPGWQQRTDDVRRMLQGDGQTPDLVRKYHVAYVVIGPQELDPAFGGNAAYWQSTAEIVYSDDGYTIYRTQLG